MKYCEKRIYVTEDGRQFEFESDAQEYCNEYILYRNMAIRKSDIKDYEKKLERIGVVAFLDEFYDLAQSNSMGAMHPMDVMKYIIDTKNLDYPDGIYNEAEEY